MMKFLATMVIPLYICVYTVQFGRWMHKKRMVFGACSAYVIAGATVLVTGVVLWRVFT